jgi:beta-N-acetylhexosaminidase
LRKRIGYRNLIVSDDLEMGGVLSAAPVGKAAAQFVAAGGDLCLVCHREDYVVNAYEELVRAAERERNFAKRVAESARKITAFKKKYASSLRATKEPSEAAVGKLIRRLWEFSEQVRLEPLSRREDRRSRA